MSLWHTNNIYVSVDGTIIDITNNVQFIINSDIYGGEYFEYQVANAQGYICILKEQQGYFQIVDIQKLK